MSRAMLFVDRGSGPACLRGVPRDAVSAEGGLHHQMLTPYQQYWYDHAARWWLVDCMSVVTGKARIAHADTLHCTPDTCACGGARILAHGSREPREAAK